MTLPSPPPRGELTGFPRLTIAAGVELYRIHLAERHPTYYGDDQSGRFNPPTGVAAFGTCYVARNLEGAFAEVFGRAPVVSVRDLERRELSVLSPVDEIEFADFTHRSILGRYRLTGEASAGGIETYPRCQQWAAALYDAGLGGVAYHARHDPRLNEISFAVFGKPGEQAEPLTVQMTGAIDIDTAIDYLGPFGFEILPPTTS